MAGQWLNYIVIGGITGAIEICITYPTEYVKTMMQLYAKYSKGGVRFCLNETYGKYGILGNQILSIMKDFIVDWLPYWLFPSHKKQQGNLEENIFVDLAQMNGLKIMYSLKKQDSTHSLEDLELVFLKQSLL